MVLLDDRLEAILQVPLVAKLERFRLLLGRFRPWQILPRASHARWGQSRRRYLRRCWWLESRLALGQSPTQIAGHKAAKLQSRHMIIVAIVQQMVSQLLRACALRTFEDQGLNLRSGKIEVFDAARVKVCEVLSFGGGVSSA